MEFANDLMTALRGRTETGGATAQGAGLGHLPDWSGLHARLSCAHALRRELVRGDSRGAPLGGAFFDWPLPASDRPKQAHPVNLNDSTDRKAPECMEAGTAGLVHAGGREQ